MKKFLLTGILLILLFVLFSFKVSSPAEAASVSQNGTTFGLFGGTWYTPSPNSFIQDLYGVAGGQAGTGQNGQASGQASGAVGAEVNDTRYINRQVAGNIAMAIACAAVNCVPQNVNNLGYAPNATGFFAGGIDTMLKVRPASSIDYIAYEMHQLHVPGAPTPVYAAVGGRGFTALQPILQIWTVSRNLAYIVFALIFIVVGFMIMTRQKIDPKTVANVQNALPKIIFALVLVTFSYAIAGFLIDIMYVLLGLVLTFAGSISPAAGNAGKDLLNGSIFSVITGGYFLGTSAGAAQAVGNIVASLLSPTPGNSVGGVVQLGVAQFLGAGVSVLAFVVIAIAILVAVFRTWLALLGAYANIILGVIFAPLRLMIDAVPGQNQFSSWMREMLSNLLAFPLVLILLLIGNIIVTTGTGNIASYTGGFVPPLIGNSVNLSAMTALVGLGILLTIPKALDILREALKAPQFKYGNAWLEATMAGWTGAQQIPRIVTPVTRPAGEWSRGVWDTGTTILRQQFDRIRG